MLKIFMLFDCNKLCINQGQLRKYGGQEKLDRGLAWKHSSSQELPLDPRIWGKVDFWSDPVR